MSTFCGLSQRLATEQAGPIWEKMADADKAEYLGMAAGALVVHGPAAPMCTPLPQLGQEFRSTKCSLGHGHLVSPSVCRP